jgi:hypothetical protein
MAIRRARLAELVKKKQVKPREVTKAIRRAEPSTQAQLPTEA